MTLSFLEIVFIQGILGGERSNRELHYDQYTENRRRLAFSICSLSYKNMISVSSSPFTSEVSLINKESFNHVLQKHNRLGSDSSRSGP